MAYFVKKILEFSNETVAKISNGCHFETESRLEIKHLNILFKYIFLFNFILILFKPAFADLNIPANSQMNVNSGTLAVTGNVNLSAGTSVLSTSTGTVKLTGNWDNTNGTYTPGTGTLEFNGSGAQSLNSGGTGAGKLFYNLKHSGTGTTTAGTNALNIDGSFINTAGTFATGGQNMTVSHAWTNTAGAATFTHGSATVTLDGTNQNISGSTTFYNLTKTIAAATGEQNLTFDNAGEQQIVGTLTLQGFNAANKLSLNSDDDDGSPSQFGITLRPAGLQSLQYLKVKNSDASGAGVSVSGLTLVAGATSTDLGNNINWAFGATTFTWQGDVSSNWSVAGNWDLGLVPSSIDSVVIPDVTGSAGVQPILTAAVTVNNLTVQANTTLASTAATLSLNGSNLTVNGTLSNLGNIHQIGTETVTIATVDQDSGTFTFLSDGGGASTTLIPNIASQNYFNVVFNDSTGLDTFRLTNNLRAYGNVTITNGSLDLSTGNRTLTVSCIVSACAHGTLTLSGGALSAAAGDINADGGVTLTGGTFTAPNAARSFTIGGNFTHSTGGTFTHSSGTVTFDGASQGVLGDQATTFYGLSKIASTTTPTFTFTKDAATTIAGNFVLQGASGNIMNIQSSLAGTQATVILSAGSTQTVDYLSVRDINSNSGLAVVARNSTESPASSTLNWFFNGASMIWEGDVSTNWSAAGNWDLGIAPVAGDTVTVPDVAGFDPTLTAHVTIKKLTLSQAGSLLTLAGFNLTVNDSTSPALTNAGTVRLQGAEVLTITSVSTTAGTFEYAGTGVAATYVIPDINSSTDYYNVTFNGAAGDVFRSAANLTAANNVTITSGTLDISTNANTLTATGSLTVGGGSLTATNGNIDANSHVVISSGTLTAPGSGKTFTVAGNWTNTAGAAFFVHSGGTVTFDPAAATTISISGTNTFNGLTSTAAGATIQFKDGDTQTVAGTLTLYGSDGNLLTVKSTVDNTDWNISVSAAQSTQFLSVRDSEVLGSADITCFNCTNVSGNDNAAASPRWVFLTLSITNPQSGKTTDFTPTIIGLATASLAVEVRLNNCVGALLGSTTANTNGDFRFESSAGVITSAGSYTIVPCLSGLAGLSRTISTVASPTASQQPTITSHADGGRINGSTPAITGQGLAGQTVTIKVNDANGNLLLASAGTGTVDGSGNYSVTLTTALPKGVNYLSAVVDGVSSDIVDVALTDPFGIVFDSVSSAPIEGAVVSIYRSATNKLALTNGVELATTDTNPLTTGADGFYSFLTANDNYYIVISATRYTYPSVQSSFPVDKTIVTGSRGEVFTVSGTVIKMDHPLDATANLLRIVKDVNKTEARIGEIVTYTITVQNLSNTTTRSVLIEDRIPAGFKYVENRVTLDGAPIANPVGQRPLVFSIGTINAQATRTLKYQLVVGSGVTVGEYNNTAKAKYENGNVISNIATQTVNVVLDPLFDMGTVLGKVFYDRNENGIQDEPEYIDPGKEALNEDPVPNVQLVMEDGTIVTSDNEGRFSVPGITPGRHLVRLDERSLPEGTYLTTDKVVIIDVTPGLPLKVNFGVNAGSGEISSDSDRFFTDRVKIVQEKERAEPKLNVSCYRGEIPAFDGLFADKAEFRIFTNYAPYIETWKLTISDKDTGKVVKKFEGNNLNIYDPVLWDGRDLNGEHIDLERNYEFELTVDDKKGESDKTIAQPIIFHKFEDKEKLEEYLKLGDDQIKSYRQWIEDERKESNLQIQNILIDGETVVINPLKIRLQSVRVMQEGKLVSDIPLMKAKVLTAREILDSGRTEEDFTGGQIEVILPRGDFDIAVQPMADGETLPTGRSVAAGSGFSSGEEDYSQTYTKKVRVGEDYMMFVAMGDAKVGYTFDPGNVEPVSQEDKYNEGFWSEGKLAYFLKGKIKGKYLVTSSFDSDREKKDIFSKIDKDNYYPVYGDSSSLNREATDTQGMLYLLIEWDKSSAIWGNYSVNFDDTEFARYSRSLYGGKVDFESLSKTKFGDAASKIVVFRAKAQQKSAHNEFLATGGSLYFVKHKNILTGSDKVRIEVRDQISGLVISSKDMVEGADYEMDYDSGRILFWKPIPVLVDAYSIVSSDLLDGNLVYVVADYEYEVKDKFEEATIGSRVREAVGDHVLVGGTYVREGQNTGTYQLRGADVTIKPAVDGTIKTEYAETESEAQNVFASTDGGLTFTELATAAGSEGRAYGISGDATLFNRLGVKSYYKWVDNNFSTSSTTAQQGKEQIGFEATYDISDQTRVTFRQDIQKLIDDGALQTQVQLGATKTSTTLLEMVHDMRRLKLTGAYSRKEVTDRKDQYVSETNVEDNTVAMRADYEVSDKIDVYAQQQIGIQTKKQQSTIGGEYRPEDDVEIRLSKAFGTQGTAASVGLSKSIGEKIKLSGDYTIFDDRPGVKRGFTGLAGEVAENANVGGTNLSGTAGTGGLTGSLSNDNLTASTDGGVAGNLKTRNLSAKLGNESGAEAIFGGEMDLGNDNKLQSSLGVTQLVTGEKTATVSVGGTARVDKDTSVKTAVGVTETAGSGQGSIIGIDAVQKIDDKSEYTSGVTVSETPGSDKTTTFNFGTRKQLTDQIQLITNRSFGQTDEDATSLGNTYGLVREKDGKKLEGTLTQQKAQNAASISDSNIFGLSGDVNDRWALTTSYERAKIQNLDGSRTQRNALAFGAGFVKRDEETGDSLKNSAKVEARFDETETGQVRQVLFYDTIEGKLTPEISLYGKIEYSKTRNTTQNLTLADHKEFMVGGAYRPIRYDRFNFLGKYTYLEEQSPEGQIDSANIDRDSAHVISIEGIYDLNDKWQVSEKFAARISEEKVEGFDFTRTHTWLMIHRLNYKIDRDWSLGGEYRLLTQKEAKDSKRGILVEAARRIGEYAQLGLGYNFTGFSDDLTEFNYNAQGPFIRLTGKIYDRTPEEAERSYQRWMNEKIAVWAWIMVNEELSNNNSPVLAQLNEYYAMAEVAHQEGDLEESRRIYKDIIAAGQLMMEEASEHIRTQIAGEKDLQGRINLADQYMKNGQYEKARKILEKVLEDIEARK